MGVIDRQMTPQWAGTSPCREMVRETSARKGIAIAEHRRREMSRSKRRVSQKEISLKNPANSPRADRESLGVRSLRIPLIVPDFKPDLIGGEHAVRPVSPHLQST